MNTFFSILLIVFGVLLIVFGVRSMESFSSDVSRFFSGIPTNRAMWLLIGGVVSVILGVGVQYLMRR